MPSNRPRAFDPLRPIGYKLREKGLTRNTHHGNNSAAIQEPDIKYQNCLKSRSRSFQETDRQKPPATLLLPPFHPLLFRPKGGFKAIQPEANSWQSPPLERDPRYRRAYFESFHRSSHSFPNSQVEHRGLQVCPSRFGCLLQTKKYRNPVKDSGIWRHSIAYARRRRKPRPARLKSIKPDMEGSGTGDESISM